MDRANHKHFPSGRLLFTAAVCFPLFLTAYLLAGRRIPGGHDGFQYFSLQYYFLNHLVEHGYFPQWMPFMTEGTVATWWYAIQAGLLQNTAVFFAPLLKGLNFLSVFHAGIFVDELILILGVWLLAGRFFHSKVSVFFVTISISGSNIWMFQPWFNFHLFYAVPMVIYFLHRFFDNGLWRHLFFAGNLLALQSLGNLPYFLPITTLVLFLYFLFYFGLNPDQFRGFLKTVKWNASAVFALTGAAVFLYFVYLLMTTGTHEIIDYSLGREADKSCSLSQFLNYEGRTGTVKWAELFLGISPFFDYTLYIGILPLTFIVTALFSVKDKQKGHFLLLILTLVLLSSGTFVSAFFYHFWPMMKYYRHISLIAPLIRVFLCFLAGFGLDYILSNRASLLPAFCFLLLMCGLFFVTPDAEPLRRLLLFTDIDPGLLKEASSGPDKATFLPRFEITKTYAAYRLHTTALYSLLYAVPAGMMLIPGLKKLRPVFLFALLIFHVFNITDYKLGEMNMRTSSLNDQDYQTTRFTPIPYLPRRTLDFSGANDRAGILFAMKSALIVYWSTQSFLFEDTANSPFKIHHWLRPLDRFMKAYGGQDILDEKTRPAGLVNLRLMFPDSHPAIPKLAGISEDKIQFFRNAHAVESDRTTAEILTDERYNGDMLFVSSPETPDAPPWSENTAPDQNERLAVDYRVTKFTADEITLEVSPAAEPVWLYYSDVWHPFWKAEINGKTSPLYKADLAFKAVKLPPGTNRVRLFFEAPFIRALQYLFGLNSALWLGAMIFLGLGIYRGKY